MADEPCLVFVPDGDTASLLERALCDRSDAHYEDWTVTFDGQRR